MSIKSWVKGSAIATLASLNAFLPLAPVLAQSAESPPAPRNAYPNNVVSAFVTTCVEAALAEGTPPNIPPEVFPVLMQNVCSCMIWQFQDRYTMTEFNALLTSSQAQDQASAQQIIDVINTCTPQPPE